MLHCKNCGHQLSGKFCSNCGEKVYTSHDKNIGHFFEEGIHFITHFDGKFFTTLKTIVLHPGKLSLDYCDGIRKKYFKPLSLFLVIVVLYLLFPKFQGLNMNFTTYVDPNTVYSYYARPIAQKKLATLQITTNELASHYNTKSEKFAKPFLLILLPLSALVLWLLYYRRKRVFFDHFVLGVELNSILVALQFLIVPLIAVVCNKIYPPSESFFYDDSLPFFILENLVMLFIITLASKKFYTQNWWWTISKSVLFLLLYSFIVVAIYKALLFYCIILFL